MLLAARTRLAGLAFPRLREDPGRPLSDPLVLVTATRGTVLVGAAFLSVLPDRPAELVSLRVDPAAQRQGVGTALVRGVEAAARSTGAAHVEASFREDLASAEALQRVLARRDWQPPERRIRQIEAVVTPEVLVATSWGARRSVPPGGTVFPWTELTDAEARALRQRQAEHPFYPPALDPFALSDLLDPAVGVGMRMGGEVAGWCLAHRVRPDLLQYSTFFVDAPYREGLAALGLLAEALRRQGARTASGGPDRAFAAIDARNTGTHRFVDRFIRPHLTRDVWWQATGKRLS